VISEYTSIISNKNTVVFLCAFCQHLFSFKIFLCDVLLRHVYTKFKYEIFIEVNVYIINNLFVSYRIY